MSRFWDFLRQINRNDDFFVRLSNLIRVCEGEETSKARKP